MERIEYVPLGSVVLLKNVNQKVLVISRAIFVKKGEKTCLFDYGGVLYPDGLVGDRMVYFNHDGINKVVFEGLNDIENQNAVDTINNYLENNKDVVRGNPEEWENS